MLVRRLRPHQHRRARDPRRGFPGVIAITPDGRTAYVANSALLRRDPAAHVSLDDPVGVASLLYSLRAAGAQDQFAALADRAAAHAPLDNPHAMASLLGSLRRAGAYEQAPTLAYRPPAYAIRADPDPMTELLTELLTELREAGAHEQATALTARLAAAGMFSFFLEQPGCADRFRFGREADGSPSAPWGWEDLD